MWGAWGTESVRETVRARSIGGEAPWVFKPRWFTAPSSRALLKKPGACVELKSFAPQGEVKGFGLRPVCPRPGVGVGRIAWVSAWPFPPASQQFFFTAPRGFFRGNSYICPCRLCICAKRRVQILLYHHLEPESFPIFSNENFSVNYEITTGQFCLHSVKNASRMETG